jgi:hypothetical protein
MQKITQFQTDIEESKILKHCIGGRLVCVAIKTDDHPDFNPKARRQALSK